MKWMVLNVCRLGEVDSSDSEDDDSDKATTHISPCESSAVSAWELACAALQVQQMVNKKYRTAPLGKQLTRDVIWDQNFETETKFLRPRPVFWPRDWPKFWPPDNNNNKQMYIVP